MFYHLKHQEAERCRQHNRTVIALDGYLESEYLFVVLISSVHCRAHTEHRVQCTHIVISIMYKYSVAVSVYYSDRVSP